ncbi:MAG TPA: hypothetical protein VGK32_18030 [Vicinamibacterales bacterium]|jgi:hypothetical protein
MTDDKTGAQAEPPPRSRTGTYVAVLVVEGLVVAVLWAFGRYFS